MKQQQLLQLAFFIKDANIVYKALQHGAGPHTISRLTGTPLRQLPPIEEIKRFFNIMRKDKDADPANALLKLQGASKAPALNKSLTGLALPQEAFYAGRLFNKTMPHELMPSAQRYPLKPLADAKFNRNWKAYEAGIARKRDLIAV